MIILTQVDKTSCENANVVILEDTNRHENVVLGLTTSQYLSDIFC